MVARRSKRPASRKAAMAIAAVAGVSKKRQNAIMIPTKYRSAKKSPKLPEGKLKIEKASHIERAREVKDLSRIVGYSDDPIQTFNDLENGQKGLLMKSLLLGFCRFLYVGGRNLAPADLHDYSIVGMPATDRAVLRGTTLREANEDTVLHGRNEPKDNPTMIHGKPRWPILEIGGNCSCTIKMDDDNRVDLKHDPYCLRKHFTTRWGVLKDQSATKWRPPKGGATVTWDDFKMIMNTSLKDRISSAWLLYRIVANFGAPPFTEDDPYTSSWSFRFWHQEDPTCYLEIFEHKSLPRAFFRGSEKSSNEALQLLEWLSGTNCPHSYDYTPCGISA